MFHLRWVLPGVLGLMCLVSGAAQPSQIGGDYSGMLGPLHVKLHLKPGGSGRVEAATLDSVDQGALGLSCAKIDIEDKELSFEVPSVGGKWRGAISDDGSTLSGKWSQGQEIPLVFRRDEPFIAAEKPSPVDGIWLGTLGTGGPKLRVQLEVKSDRAGKESCSLDSLDQQAMGLPCDNVQFAGKNFSLEVPLVRGHWSGTLADSGNELNGTWSQGKGLPLNFTRQTAALNVKPPEPPKYEDALPAVPAAELKGVLDKDLAAALHEGPLAPSTGGGLAIGVVQHGTRRILVYGPVKEDSIFEIGSITKTFTGLMLAQMALQNKVKLDEPVRELLPPGTVGKPAGAEITLVDLATQHSGLPRMPDNFHPADPQDPYADYGPADLYEFLKKYGVAKPTDTGFNYSNLGLGLLGQALADRAGTSYPTLLRSEVTGPLELNDTAVALSPEQEKRFAQGHSGTHQPAHAWKLDALAGAGAIRSTASDMLTYLEANLHPDTVKTAAPTKGAESPSETLVAALKMSHELRAEALP
ncbi:MAG: serine hydrolase, partial [Acidobacteriota bacterium]|nr:serine hydrolase [Acidobacteriota bacterium]